MVQVAKDEYNLLLQNDINTKGYTQWFYFSVSQTARHQRVKFNIVNYYKPGSLFNEGMKVLVYSKKQAQSSGTGWFRGGTDIMYVRNNIVKDTNDYQIWHNSFYSLSFGYQFEHDDDTVYFAYCYPYT